ncbi:MAG: LTA synthase family protein [Arachidicoccus sp.]|nr:LTA synthase family protein [Arachidicoccus sp.]
MLAPKFWKPFLWLIYFYLCVSVILRIVLLLNPITTAHFNIGDYLKIFVKGALNDILIFILLGSLFWLYYLFLSNNKFKKPHGYIIFCSLVLLLCYLSFFNNILKQYGNVVPLIGIVFVGFKTLIFGLMLFFPKLRKPLRITFYFTTIFLFVSLILLNALSEYYFWNEFGMRYNFIAVDYLIYTNEVIGNILESYPVVPLFAILGLIALTASWFIVYKTKNCIIQLPAFITKIKIIAVYGIVVVLCFCLLPLLNRYDQDENVFESELQSNGVYKFYIAFMNNHLDYFKFYPTIDQRQAFQLLKDQIPGIQTGNSTHDVKDSLPEIHKNVVLITVESLSEDYLAHFGNTNHLTPFLDSLADNSIFFTNLYATGNRTVRGLEAVTLCIPPAPGESVIKQKNNKDKFCTGYIFKQKGYQVKFLYGGYSYFDNMKDFYEGNGYDIVDRTAFAPKEISFANIWGVCDEDMAKKAVKIIHTEAATGKPFFNHWMTVSNHRPFTYPNGKIDIPGDSKSREGGVKYTDYALRRFFEMSEKEAWFNNTVFIIVADHCASSSGKTALPMSKYRIPCIVYSPGFIQPRQINKLMSQIDIMPTVMGLLHFSYSSKFIGQNILDSDYIPRAFIATYEDMGFIKDSVLTVLSPLKQTKQYTLIPQTMINVEPQFQYQYKELPAKNLNTKLKDEAISYYQTAAWLLKNNQYQK